MVLTLAQNRHKPTSEIGFSRGGLCLFSRLFSRLFLILGDDSQVSSTDSFTDSSSIQKKTVSSSHHYNKIFKMMSNAAAVASPSTDLQDVNWRSLRWEF